MEVFNLKGVEIFSSGTWNGDVFTVEDLNDMVKTFEENKAGVQPYIKLGHDKKQKIAEKSDLQKDGLPALGWIDKMYTKGDKLIADFADIPKKVYDLIKVGAYKKVSCEMFFNVKIKEKKFKHLITAVSLLGADTPAVMNLNDIHALYFESEEDPKEYVDNALEFKYEEINRKDTEMSKTEKEIKLEADLEAKEKLFTAEKEKADKLAQEKADQEKELATLKQFKADQEKKDLENSLKLKEEQTKNFVNTLVSEKLCTLAMKPLITELLSDKKEFSTKSGNKELKTREEILKEALKLFSVAEEVNFEESTKDDKSFKADQNAEDEKKMQKYMKDEKMSAKQAYAKVMKEKKG